MANTWSTGVWGQNEWGDQGPVVITLTGQSATSSVGQATAAQIINVTPSGQSVTSSIGSLTLELTSNISLTGLQSQTELGILITQVR